MKTRISIRACEHAIAITRRWGDPGIPLEVDGEERRITGIEIRKGGWYSGDHRFTRQEKEQLTQKAKAIMEHDRGPSNAAGDIHSGVSGGDRDCLRHQDLAAGRGEANHGSQDRWGREYPMVQRRSSLHRNRAAPTHSAGEGHY